ncbi:MAG: bifunctional phosphopantothenoylcysteine decarboxylase/phosphopantothenate--cysteine ligase CoaBC [Dehalococcoidales bacterium]
MLEGKEIVQGITGSIAAYKGADIASKLTQAGAAVSVVLTESAARFITPLTFESITGKKALSSLWENQPGVNHISLAEKADCILIAPATANIIAKIAGGFADDMLSCLVLARHAPVVIAPAMHTAMYENPVTQKNITRLEELGFIIVEPGEGHLASGDYGRGRLADTGIILGTVKWVMGKGGDLAGKNIVITSGGTREPLDPVRYLGNRSSGKTGYFLAQAARDRGAMVTLVTTCEPSDEAVGIDVEYVGTAREMLSSVNRAVENADCLIMAAAVADFRPAETHGSKIKKGVHELDIHLVSTVDILSQAKGKFIRVGFAAETENLEKGARDKLLSKGLDLVVANDVTQPGGGFGADSNRVSLLYKDGKIEKLSLMPKSILAHRILDAVKSIGLPGSGC